MARLEDAQLYMQGLREENPAAATRASSPRGRAWLARGASQITAAMEEAKKAAAKRREEATGAAR